MRLPFGLRNRINSWRTGWYLGPAIRRLRPLQVATKDLAAEVHMMVSGCHLYRAMACLHTLFGFSGIGDRVGVMFHLDGTVNARQRRWLERNVPGAAFSDFPSNDQRVLAILEKYPHCRDYYLRRVSCMTRLIHTPALARTDRVIQIDSDIVFWAPGQEIIEWIDNPAEPPKYQVCDNDQPVASDKALKAFADFQATLPSSLGRTSIQHYYFVVGLTMFPGHRFSFDMVEHYLRWHARGGRSSDRDMFFFWDWTVEQTASMLAFSLWPDSQRLGSEYVVGLKHSNVSNHYFTGQYYRRDVLLKIREALDELVHWGLSRGTQDSSLSADTAAGREKQPWRIGGPGAANGPLKKDPLAGAFQKNAHGSRQDK
jgi:hypothetical protein